MNLFGLVHFIRPGWLLLLPLVVLLPWAWRRSRRAAGDWSRVCDPHLLRWLAVDQSGDKPRRGGPWLAGAAPKAPAPMASLELLRQDHGQLERRRYPGAGVVFAQLRAHHFLAFQSHHRNTEYTKGGPRFQVLAQEDGGRGGPRLTQRGIPGQAVGQGDAGVQKGDDALGGVGQRQLRLQCRERCGQALRKPAPLFKKLDESVVEEEYVRLEG